jgi:hypothetical protein
MWLQGLLRYTMTPLRSRTNSMHDRGADMSAEHKNVPHPGPFAAESPEERVEKLRAKAAEKAGGAMSFYEGDDVPEEVLEKFWEGVIRFDETSPKPLDVLRDEDLVMPPADELDDEGIHKKLWDIIFAMSMHRWYLQQTDHLSDRELYRELIEYLLLEVTSSTSPDTNMHIDILGGCSEHDLWLCARYYWDESFREDWLERFPDTELPERIDPPYDRDRHLPRPSGPGYPRPDGPPVVM